ncbi:ABC transporter substrate-binding protein [Ottowia flava]|nr:ABC transporter substrate-binding protein [Ottowia sp. GY511]
MALIASPLAVRAQSSEPIRIGQSTALSGALGDLGRATRDGAQAAFEAVNAAGGIHGRRVEPVVMDDGYDAGKAVANIDTLLADRSIFLLSTCFGTPAIEAMLPKVLSSGIPFFAPYTGATSARAKARNVINVRASYPEEAEQVVRHLSTIGLKRVAIAWQNNAFGKEVEGGAARAIQKHGLTQVASVSVEGDSSNVAEAVAKLVAAEPQAVVLGLAGKPALDTVKGLRAQRRGLSLYGLSVLGAATTLKAMGADGVGVTISQVVPSPVSQSVPLSRDFQRDWKAARIAEEPSYVAMEGYLNARLLAEMLRRAGPAATRQTFLDTVWGTRQLDLGGFPVGFSEPGRSASTLVELTMIGRDGRFLR